MTTPNEFMRRMGIVGTTVTRNADRVVRKVAMAIDRTVVLATPVDTGRARANWIAALDAATSTSTETKDKTGAKAMEQAAGVIAGYNGENNTEIHLTNNLPYIQQLNEGSSAQAPAEFVSAAVRIGVKAVKDSRLLTSSSSEGT